MEVLAGVEEVGEFDDELDERLGVELALAVLHVILEGGEADAGGLGAGGEVVADAGEELAVGLDEGGELGIALDAVLCVHH